MDLTAADLVKNYVLSVVPETLFDTTYKHWRSMVDNIGDDQLSRYLRASWNSKYEFARQADLYREVSKRVVATPGNSKTKTGASSFVKSLDDESIDWEDLRNPDGTNWMAPYPDLREDLNDLRLLDARLVYVPLLALRAAHRTEPKEFAKAVRLFRDFYVRHTIVAGRAANEVEEDYSKWAGKIRGKTMSLSQLQANLHALSPDDKTFKLRPTDKASTNGASSAGAGQ